MPDSEIYRRCNPCFADPFNETLCPEELMVLCAMYPKTLIPFEYLLPVTIVLAVIFFIGLLSNAWIIVNITRKQQDFFAPYYYLLCLAISDLAFLLFGMPYDIWFMWSRYPDIFGQLTCQLHKLITESTGYASSLNIMVFSLERYKVIRRPFSSHTSGRTVALIMTAIWIISIAFSLPFALQFESRAQQPYPPDQKVMSPLSTICQISKGHAYLFSYFLGVSFLLFWLPLLILTGVYVRLGLSLRSRVPQESSGARIIYQQNKKTYTISAILVTSYFVCWLPGHLQRILTATHGLSEKLSMQLSTDLSMQLYVLASVCNFLSAAINPFMYKRQYDDAAETHEPSVEIPDTPERLNIYLRL